MMTRTVTLYQRQVGQPVRFTGHILRNVFFREGSGTDLSPQGAAGGSLDNLLLIPAEMGISPKPGDGVLLEEGPVEPPAGDIREQVPGCRMVTAVVSRLYGSLLDHWEVHLR